MNHSTGLINNLTPLARILLTYIKELSLESIRIESNEIVNHLCYNIFQSDQVNEIKSRDSITSTPDMRSNLRKLQNLMKK